MLQASERQKLGKTLADVTIELKGGIRAYEKIGYNKKTVHSIQQFIHMIANKLFSGYMKVFPKGCDDPKLDSVFGELQHLYNSETERFKKMSSQESIFNDALKMLKIWFQKINKVGLDYIGFNWLE